MIYIYGGAFDPVTKAHLEIVKMLNKHLADNDRIIVSVTNNNEKNYTLPYEARVELLRYTLRQIIKLDQPLPEIVEQRSRMYVFLKTTFKKADIDNITIIVGEDEWKDLVEGKWAHSEELLKEFKFKVINRYGQDLPVPTFAIKGFDLLKVKNTSSVSSSNVRNVFYTNPDVKYKEVQDFLHISTFKLIKDLGYYWQNGEKYEAEMEEFLSDYAKKKEENHWGEPSVTTDIVAYNGDNILLIRRLKPPYRNYWALPGGFWEKTDVDLNYGAAREFKEETTLDYDPSRFDQIKAYGHNFDPRMKICDVAFAVRIHKEDMKSAVGADDAAEAKWFKLNELPALAFHHRQIIDDWMETKNKDE